MDYRAHLLLPLSKRYIDQLALEVFIHPETFARIYELIFDTDTTVAWRAAWACQKISEKQPELFTDKQFNELAAFTIASSHDGIKRGCLGTLNNLPLPQPIPRGAYQCLFRLDDFYKVGHCGAGIIIKTFI